MKYECCKPRWTKPKMQVIEKAIQKPMLADFSTEDSDSDEEENNNNNLEPEMSVDNDLDSVTTLFLLLLLPYILHVFALRTTHGH